MTEAAPTLYLLCGKIAAGKSTLARRLGSAPACLLISEDAWLSELYPGEIQSLADYARCAERLRAAMGDHVQALLRAGLSVVLDFPANTVAARQWMRGIFEGAGADHELHVLDVPDAVCKTRLHQRNLTGAPVFAPDEADYDRIAGFFVPPAPEEGFNLVVHSGA
ncbi:ATP-binding protein [Pelagibius litoralis]|uniref:ATP-binding protein n=1 Tax=Pelagibius litoralis TaxID=374515 RepID=A0A967F130_9PROT|nr:ATP-binding protein [Pelagibius litoralis]NIA71122.1 ATP-binding protein [Pelagibius litoralis]